jgi:hypothetical protein
MDSEYLMAAKHPVDAAFKPVPVHEPGTPEHEAAVTGMRDNIVKTYLAATPAEHTLGERFYTRDAHGAARAMATGQNPSEGVGRVMRETPHHQELATDAAKRDASWGHSAANPKPQTPLGAHVAERVHRAAGVLARLSPQTEWETNVRQAHEAHHMSENATGALHNIATGAVDTSRKPNAKGEFPRPEVRNDAGQKMDLNKQPNEAIRKAHEIASGKARPEDYVAMDPTHRVKIGTFAQNIEHPGTSPNVTVDFRTHDISVGKLLSTSTARGLSANPKSKTRDVAGRRYDMLDEAHSRAAAYVNENHPDRRLQSNPIDAKQMQAVTWWADKNHQDESMGGVMSGGHFRAGANGGVLRRTDLGRPVGQGNNEDRGTWHLGPQFGG